MLDRDALRREVMRIHQRYAREVVETFGFCPWAIGARERGRVQTRVLFGAVPDLEQTLHEVESLEFDESADIGLLVFPELTSSRLSFQHFAASVRERHEERAGRGQACFAIADFHPDAAPDLASAERLVAYIRRSPDPLLQLLRHSALDAVRRGEQPGTRFVDPALLLTETERMLARPAPLHERVARANFETMQRVGLARVAAVLDDILGDRDQSYARQGLAPPPWSARRRESAKV